MREIKFRAWDKETKKMRAVNSIAFHYENEAFDFDSSHLPKVINVWGQDIIEEKPIILNREPKDVILMQFTGLKDKNGKEIYEGDILIDDEYPEDGISYGKVSWGIAGWTVDPWFTTEEFEKEVENYEVIGNIYENPELLKSEA